MKKLLASLVVFSFLLVGCGGSSSEEFEVALVTDAGDINDKSFNQSAWEAVEQYQKDHDATIKYYKPASFDDAGYKSQIEEAVENKTYQFRTSTTKNDFSVRYELMQLVNYKINTKMSNLS